MFKPISPDKRINREIKSTNSTETMFQKRPFAVHSSKTPSNGKKNFSASLSQAQKYGHSLNNTQAANAVSSTQNTAVAQCKNIDKKKEGGIEGSTVGSGISNVVGNAATALSAPFAVSTGVLALPEAVNDANDAIGAYKQGNKSKATVSGTKASATGAGAGATIAGFAGDAINAVAAGSVGGGAGVVTGGIDALKGGKNVKKAKDSYGEVKGVARGAAEKLSPQNADSKPRSTKELQGVLGQFSNLEGKIGEKRDNVNSLTGEINNLTPKQKPDDKAREKLRESRNDRKSLRKQQKGLKNEKADLKEDKKHADVLDVALHTTDGLEKTKKREGINTAAGGLTALGGGLAIAGAAGAGIGAIPGAVVGATGASMKPGAAGVRKAKQKLRDKGVSGTNQDKTTAKKDAQRQRIAGKMAHHRDVAEMQTIFGNLPGVTEEQTNRFKGQKSNNLVARKEIQESLKRRNY